VLWGATESVGMVLRHGGRYLAKSCAFMLDGLAGILSSETGRAEQG